MTRKMGKIYKHKRRSCAMCKPHKMGWECKRKHKDEVERKDAEEEMIEETRRER